MATLYGNVVLAILFWPRAICARRGVTQVTCNTQHYSRHTSRPRVSLTPASRGSKQNIISVLSHLSRIVYVRIVHIDSSDQKVHPQLSVDGPPHQCHAVVPGSDTSYNPHTCTEPQTQTVYVTEQTVQFIYFDIRVGNMLTQLSRVQYRPTHAMLSIALEGHAPYPWHPLCALRIYYIVLSTVTYRDYPIYDHFIISFPGGKSSVALVGSNPTRDRFVL